MIIAREAPNKTIGAARVEVGRETSSVARFASRRETVLRSLSRDSELRHVIVRQRWQGLFTTSEMPLRWEHRKGREH